LRANTTHFKAQSIDFQCFKKSLSIINCQLSIEFMRFFFFLFFLGSQMLHAQKTDSLAFPASWAGVWAGTLDIFNGKGKVQSVSMEIELLKIDTSRQGRYTFGLVYGDRSKDYRPYELVPVDPAKGLWRVDEKNSIVMESYLYGPKLLCWFVVEGARVLCTYEKTGDNTMVFEVVSGKESAVSTTGSTKQGDEDIPEVKTFPFSAFQRAVLHPK
jgi:hypothetical protein